MPIPCERMNRMAKLRGRVCLLAGLLLLGLPVQAAEESLALTYRAILNGDFEAGRAELSRLLDAGKADSEAQRVESWLAAYQRSVADRDELRENTFNWNMTHAREALDQGKVFLSLAFASQAQLYAADEQAFSNDPWVQQLTQRALQEAESHEKAEKWGKALAYYGRLARIHEKDKSIEDRRDRAAIHARLEFVYKDKEAVDRRIKDVDYRTLEAALREVNDSFYEKPDFKKMADGAIENLDALCETSKLYEVFDGVAAKPLREHFRKKLTEMRGRVHSRLDFGVNDLIRLYREIAMLNRESIELPDGMLIVEFVEGALRKLDDFTSVIWPADAADFDKMMVGGFEGVGIQLGVDEDTERLKVVTPLEDSPALEAGIMAGDLIIGVDGEDTKGWTTEDAVREITGKAGTPVTLTMYRPGEARKIDFKLNRRKIQIRTVRGVERSQQGDGSEWNYMLDPAQGIAYIRLTGFNPDSQKELSKALDTAKSQGMRGLILDLRYNPGGLLDTAVATVSTFLDKGEVVSTRGRREKRDHLEVLGDAEYADLPLVVLVNEGSASASEILAGALQDHERGLVLGERTFGKGSVQRVLEINRATGARLKLTTALYYLPDGRSPHRKPDADVWGVDPDWMIELTPKEMAAVIERQNRMLVINRTPAPKPVDEESLKRSLDELKDDGEVETDEEMLLTREDIELLQSDPHKAPDVDPQLETALLQLRVKLAGNLQWPRHLAVRTAPSSTPSTP